MADTLYLSSIEIPRDAAGKPIGFLNLRGDVVRDAGKDSTASYVVPATGLSSTVAVESFSGPLGDLLNLAFAGSGVALAPVVTPPAVKAGGVTVTVPTVTVP